MAANAGTLAVLAWIALYLVTTQIGWVRAASPFGDDPWDAVVSYVAIFLPIVVGATFVRSIRHREPSLAPATSRRIRTGIAMSLGAIGLNAATDALALLVVPLPDPSAASDGRLGLIIGLVAAAAGTTLLAAGLLGRAYRVAAAHRIPDAGTEPDLLDDLLGLAGEVPGGARLARPIDRFLADSPMSPRRHRLIFGLLGAVVAGIAFDVWHAIREGPWASPTVLLLFAGLIAVGVLGGYLLTIGPLRLIRGAG